MLLIHPPPPIDVVIPINHNSVGTKRIEQMSLNKGHPLIGLLSSLQVGGSIWERQCCSESDVS